jgi:hypothetical protein
MLGLAGVDKKHFRDIRYRCWCGEILRGFLPPELTRLG